MAISVVHTTASNVTSITIPSTAPGNCLVVCINAFGNTQSVSGITLGGSAGNFGSLISVGGGAGTNPLTAIWADPNCAGSQTAIAISGTLSVDNASGGVVIFEVSGLAATLVALLDKSSSGTSSATSYDSGTTATTTSASEILIGSANVSGSPASPAGYTNTTNTGGFSIAGYQIVSSTTTARYNGTQTSGPYTAAVATLKAGISAVPAKQLTGLNQAIMRSAVW